MKKGNSNNNIRDANIVAVENVNIKANNRSQSLSFIGRICFISTYFTEWILRQ